jgi:hypothetical protein
MGFIVIKLMGGLGNQLFQLSSALYVAEQAGLPLVLDVSWFEKNKCHDGFSLPKILDLNKLGVTVSGAPSRLRAPIKVRESIGAIDRAILYGRHMPNWMGLQLRGYWQIAAIAEKIQKRLTDSLHVQIVHAVDTYFLHIRRGDYVEERNKKLHDVLPSTYYFDAVNLVNERHGRPEISVVSDDMDYARRALKELPHARYKLLPPMNTFQTFWVLQSCKGAICANSTFSWWAAFLQKNRECWILPDYWDSFTSRQIQELKIPSGSVRMPNGLVIQ